MVSEDNADDRPYRSGTPPNRALSVVDSDGKELFEVEELNGREEVSRVFELSLRLRRLESTGRPPAELLGVPLILRWQIGAVVVHTINGMFQEFARTSQRGRYRRYEAVFVPAIWPLTQNRNCRILQERTVPEIVDELLHGYVAESRLQRKDYDRRPQCVQFMESDFAFAQRLMEDEGIHFYFDHGRQSKLVIADTSLSNPSIAEPKQLRVRDASGQVPETGGIDRLEVAQEEVASGVRCVDHCFQLENSRIEAIEPQSWSNVSFESYGQTAHHFDVVRPDGSLRPDALANVGAAVHRQADLRSKLFATDRKRLTATSDIWHITPGLQFDLTNAGAKDDGAYLVTAIDHSYRLHESKGWILSNQFECLPIHTPFLPHLRTPKPTMGGLHVATVVGPKDVSTSTDPYGRVQLRFGWQSAKREQEQTCWVRLAQVWAGKKYGAVQTPRVGHEVLVEFLDDDPDRPVVVGSLYGESHSPPCTLPDKAAITGVCSKTNGGAEGRKNELFFVDEPGNEELYLHAGRNAHFSAERSMTHLVGWGTAPTGELDFLFGSSRSSTADFPADVDPGRVHKVKGVKRNSVWGHEIDVTLGTSSDIVIGGWSEAHVGVGTAIDIGVRTNLMIGLHVEMNIAPQLVFSIGNYADIGTATRYEFTAKSLTHIVGGDYIEKIGGNRTIMFDGISAIHTRAQPEGNFQYLDVSKFRLCTTGPEYGSDDALKLSALDKLLQAPKLGADAPMVEALGEDDIITAKATKQTLLDKYSTSLTTELGDIVLASQEGNMLFAAENIRLVGAQVNFHCDNAVEFHEDVEGKELKKLIGAFGDFYREKHQIHVRDALLMREAAEAQIAATQASAMIKGAGAIASVAVAGAAVAGSVVAATKADPDKWGL